VMTGFLFAFCMCVSLDFNSELFLVSMFRYLFVSLRSQRIFAHSKTEAPSSYSFFVDE